MRAPTISAGGGGANDLVRGARSFLNSFGPVSSGPKEDPKPLTGEEYREWVKSLKDVEVMLGQPDMRREAAKVRLRAMEMRKDYRQHSASPQWGTVETRLVDPLKRLRRDVQEAIARKDDQDQRVPVDRDPVPEEYREFVETYYRTISSGETPPAE